MACPASTQIGQALCKPVGRGLGPRNGTGFRATGTSPVARGVKKTTVSGPRGSITKIKGL